MWFLFVSETHPKVPRKVAEVIDRCITNDIRERYQNAEQMKAALAKVL